MKKSQAEADFDALSWKSPCNECQSDISFNNRLLQQSKKVKWLCITR